MEVRPVVAPRAKRGCNPPIKQRPLNNAKWGEAVRHQTDASVRSSSISSTTTGACYFNDETPRQAAARCLMRHSNCEREGYIRDATPHRGSLCTLQLTAERFYFASLGHHRGDLIGNIHHWPSQARTHITHTSGSGAVTTAVTKNGGVRIRRPQRALLQRPTPGAHTTHGTHATPFAFRLFEIKQ
jgi:hypothetical protein